MTPGSSIDCAELYELLRRALLEYSELLSSAEIEIFAIQMEIAPGEADSADPALRDEFLKLCPRSVTRRDGFLIAADFVENELVLLRRVELAKSIVEDIRAAASSPINAAAPLRSWIPAM